MASTFENIINNTSAMVTNTIISNAVSNIGDMSSGLLASIFDVSVSDFHSFNMKNYAYMQFHMLRNIYEKQRTLAYIGDNAYANGDANNDSIPPLKPTYTNGNNYSDFYGPLRNPKGMLSTSVKDTNGKNINYFFDFNGTLDGDDKNYSERKGSTNTKLNIDNISNEYLKKNSILYKTQKLFKENKIKSIISEFHTNGVTYDSQIGSKFGESRGRNLLTKDAELNSYEYPMNGYKNPYCRVWTHHHQYDRFSRTMRSDSCDINYWGDSFNVDKTNNPDAWGWRDKENQDRRKQYSALDTETGLLKITPQYRGGGELNRHTKSCMFSIENLAWKDYDPYSFEQALSWEQRGPFGGRIMWFPPYGISITETSNARWNENNFIGRGESVYTYANSTRGGNLSFIMLVDHPSSVDYSSWYNDSSNYSGVDGAPTENDYLRYFAGCFQSNSSNNENGDSTSGTIYSENGDGLRKVPTPLSDEFTKQQDIKLKQEDKDTNVEDVIETTTSETTIEFLVYFPNNYSGYYDFPTTKYSKVNAILYLLFGKNCEKQGQVPSIPPTFIDTELNISNISTLIKNGTNGVDIIGYEMSDNGITTNDYDVYNVSTSKYPDYIPGGQKYTNDNEFVFDKHKRWRYRIDHKHGENSKAEIAVNGNEGVYKVSEFFHDEDGYHNTQNQTLGDPITGKVITENYGGNNYVDTCSYKLNLIRDNSAYKDKENLYTFSEVACALYNDDYKDICNNLKERGTDNDKVEELIQLFKDNELKSLEFYGMASNMSGANSELKNNRDIALAKSRSNTIKYWLSSFDIFKDIESKDTTDEDNIVQRVDLSEEARKDNNSIEAKQNRFASCKMTFIAKTETTDSTTKDKSTENADTTNFNSYHGFTPTNVPQGGNDQWKYYIRDYQTTLYIQNNNNGTEEMIPYETKTGGENEIWVDKGNGILRLWNNDTNERVTRENNIIKLDNNNNEYNRLRYDQEYHFYKQYMTEHPFVYEKLQEKIKYFNPAFHSMTPEGFNARLTFLHQCTRQGNSKTMSDFGGKTANNLAFGRAPYCILRLGDFYNQMIVIENVSFDYSVSDGLQWDLNTEGNGVQPMLCKVNINFKFIGGGDITGPVQRLQNAMSFNYYANTSFYDNRADRPEFGKTNYQTMGGAGNNNNMDIDSSYTYMPKMYDATPNEINLINDTTDNS